MCPENAFLYLLVRYDVSWLAQKCLIIVLDFGATIW